MSDGLETREELLAELQQLRARVEELEGRAGHEQPRSRDPRPERLAFRDGRYTIEDLVDIEQLRQIFEKFSAATGFTTGFLSYPDLNVLIGTGWHDICTKFHRGNEESVKVCKASNAALLGDLKDMKEIRILPCDHGLVDGATPIYVRGVHIADLATGQIFFQEPDREFYRKHGERFGYDVDAYLAAVDEVPVVDREQFTNVLQFLAEIAVVLAEQGLRNLELQEYADRLAEEIHEREQVEEDRLLLGSALEQANELIMLLDRSGICQYVNPACESVLGYAPNEFVNRNPFETPAFLTSGFSFEKSLRNRLLTGKGWRGQLTVTAKDESSRILTTTISPVHAASGAVDHFVSISLDVTREKELVDRVTRSQKLETLGMLAAGVAHDLNNVLGAMVGYPDILISRAPDDERLRRGLEKIRTSGERAAEIVQDLLTLARRGVPKGERVDLGKLALNYLKSPEHLSLVDAHPNVCFDVEIEDPLPLFEGSALHLTKTIMNLVCNAAEAIPEAGGRVVLRMDRADQEFPDGDEPIPAIRFRIIDEGAGIPKEELGRIFEPFYTKKTMGRSGSGLGLPIVWGTVEDHNGHIEVDSVLGEGTTFTLLFPAGDGAETIAQPGVELESRQGMGETILVVDDMESQREIAEGMLQHLGYRVVKVASGEDAVEYFGRHDADLVLVDMIMDPGMDGLDTCKALIGMRPELEIIIVSGYAETARVREALGLSGGAFLTKPYSLDALAREVRLQLTRSGREARPGP